jgi:hypothetical protein
VPGLTLFKKIVIITMLLFVAAASGVIADFAFKS